MDNVGAAAVNQTFIDGLLGADYKRYSAATMEQRRCIVQEGYAVRDALAAMANALGVLDDCSPHHSSVFLTYPEGVATTSEAASGTTPEPVPASAPAPAPTPSSAAWALCNAGLPFAVLAAFLAAQLL